jgi:Microtubule associated protein (MAP65/ASE1 family)
MSSQQLLVSLTESSAEQLGSIAAKVGMSNSEVESMYASLTTDVASIYEEWSKRYAHERLELEKNIISGTTEIHAINTELGKTCEDIVKKLEALPANLVLRDLHTRLSVLVEEIRARRAERMVELGKLHNQILHLCSDMTMTVPDDCKEIGPMLTAKRVSELQQHQVYFAAEHVC